MEFQGAVKHAKRKIENIDNNKTNEQLFRILDIARGKKTF